LFVKQVSVFLGIGTVVDSKIPTEYAVNFGQSGLTLPQKVFYDNADAVAKLKSYLLEMLRLYENVPAENVQARVDAVVEFEKQLAAIWIPLNDLRDPVATYNKYSYDSLKSTFPGIQWDALLPAFLTQDITSKVSFLIDSPKYLQDLQGLVSKTGKDVIVDYMKLRAITSYASYLPAQFVNNRFDFFGKYLSGIQEMPSQSKKCAQILDSNLGDILGRYYVERAFPGDSKTVSETMITYIRNAFGKNLPKVSWMDDQTKKAALTKLSEITDLIGYPDNWTDYSDIFIKPRQFFDNVLVTNQFSTQKSLSNLGKSVRKDLWQMTPPTVNAYYDPTLNSINFPAGILQPSFFNISYPMAMNFGGIGMVAGHELSHGFDDQGRQFDGTGKLTTWWTDASVANFKTQAQCYIDQYNQFTVYDLHVHGDQTLGENIADNSGIKTSFYAYQDWKAKNGEEARVLPELTNEQLFFLAYGQGWCAKSSEANAKQRVETDVHSPPQYRILGPLQNSYEFAQTFKCAKNTRMNPDKKCQLW
jgi:putative endopeptidase